MICCSCGKEIDINYGREYWNGIYCKKCADEMLSTPEYIKNYKRIIADLQAENAALKERLERAVELPCKIGDEVYEVHGKCDRKNCLYNGYYGQWRCSYGGKRNCNSFITVNKFCYSDIPRVGKTIFVTKKAAEARLKELKENNNDQRRTEKEDC